MCRHRSVSLNNEKNCCEISGDKIAFCEKTAGLRNGKFSDSNSAYLKVLVPVKIFQFQDMLNESERYQDAANGLYVCLSGFTVAILIPGAYLAGCAAISPGVCRK